jgi:hypothetical protein
LIEVGRQRETAIGRDEHSPSIAQASTDRNGHGHDHCLMAPHRRDRSIETSNVTFWTPVGASKPFALVACTGPRAPPVAILSIAPKTSPPA